MAKQDYFTKPKPQGYFGNVRKEVVAEVPLGSGAVLEIGCGEGGTGATLKAEGRAAWVSGVELFAEAAAEAAKKLDEVIVGDIEKIELPFVENQFDVLVLGDVLEHLVDPWGQLDRLCKYLAPQGIIIASLPNVRNWRVILPLVLSGKWEYQNSGIMDRTHLRFFTRRGIVDLFQRCGLVITKISPTSGGKSKMLLRLPLGFMEGFIAPQYLIIARRSLGKAQNE